MSFELPVWLARWFGIDFAGGEESVVGRLELLRPLGSTVMLLAALVGLAIVAQAYFGGESGSRRKRFLLGTLRLLTLLSLLLMIGELSISLRRAGLPYVVVLVDDSESMNIVDRYVDEQLREDLKRRVARALPPATPSLSEGATSLPTSRLHLVRALLLEDDASFLRRLSAKHYQLQAFTVSDAARRLPSDVAELQKAIGELKAGGPATRLGDGLRAAMDELRGRPIAAVILLSDGVNTAGSSPTEAAALAAERNSAVFTVGFGETRKALDVEVAELKVRDRVTINDPVTFDFNVVGRGAAGKKVELVLRSADEKTPLAKKTVTLGPDDAGQPVRLTYRPPKVGTFRYVVEAQPLANEATVDNNKAEAALDVRTDQIDVLLVESYPSFEFRYLKQMLGRDSTVRLTCVLQEADPDFPRTDPTVTTVFPVTLDELLKYDAIIFGDVDPEFLGSAATAALRDYVLEKGRGVIFAAGPRYMPQAYRGTPLAELLPLDWNKAETAAASAETDGIGIQLTPAAAEEPIFQLADDGGDSKALWKALPPLYWVWKADLRKTAQTMVETVVDEGGTTRLPVVVLQRAGRGIVLFHTTDETWRWRFRLGDVYFGRYWIQALRHLCLAHDGSRPAVLRVADERYELGKPIAVEVRFQDERFVPTDGTVNIVVESDGKPSQTVKLAPRRNLRVLFEASLSGLAEGRYRVRLAKAEGGDRNEENPLSSVTGDEFVVAAARAESFPLEANFDTLRAAAEKGRGKFYTLADVGELFDRLPSGKLSPTEPLPPISLWNRWFTVLALVALLVTEWVLRKRQGLV